MPAHIKRLSTKILAAAHSILFSSHACSPSSNLSVSQLAVLTRLTEDPSLTIRPSDKGKRWVIMNHSDYRGECLRLLRSGSSYTPLTHSVSSPLSHLLDSCLNRLLTQNYINRREFRFLSSPAAPRDRVFNILPKLHKPLWPSPEVPPGRPIVSDVGSESRSLATFIEFFLFPFVSRLDSFLLDSSHLLARLEPFTLLPGSLLCTLDVRSLYTQVPIDEGIRRVSRAFLRHPDSGRPDSEVLFVLEHCLRNNDFLFEDSWWLQTSGVAMGKARF